MVWSSRQLQDIATKKKKKNPNLLFVCLFVVIFETLSLCVALFVLELIM